MTKDEWDGLDEGMCSIVLESIREKFKEFYAPKPKKVQFIVDELDLYGGISFETIRRATAREMMYMRGGPMERLSDIATTRDGHTMRDADLLKELSAFTTRGPIGGIAPTPVRITPVMMRKKIEDEKPRIDVMKDIDFSGIEKLFKDMMPHVKTIIAEGGRQFGKSEMYRRLYGAPQPDPTIVVHYDESHHVKPEELYSILEKEQVAYVRPERGAGKNPFAQHTIRSMKGKRK